MQASARLDHPKMTDISFMRIFPALSIKKTLRAFSAKFSFFYYWLEPIQPRIRWEDCVPDSMHPRPLLSMYSTSAAGLHCILWSYQANDNRHTAWWQLQGGCNRNGQGEVQHSQFCREQSVLFFFPNYDAYIIWHVNIILWPCCKASVGQWWMGGI